MQMEIDLDEHRRLLRDSAKRLVEQHGGPKKYRTMRAEGLGVDRSRIRHLANAGWVGILVPESKGGSGLGIADLVIGLQEFGRGFVCEPLGGLAVSARLLAENCSVKVDSLLTDLLSGNTIVTPAFSAQLDGTPHVVASADGTGYRLRGQIDGVPSGGDADAVLVEAVTDKGPIIAMMARDCPGMSVTPTLTYDGGNQICLHLRDVLVSADEVISGDARSDRAESDDALDLMLVALSAELVGLMDGALEITLDHLNLREQFGRPLSRFQALQHAMVDNHIEVELTRALLYQVCSAFDEGICTRHVVAALKAQASKAAINVTKSAVQLHGAIGFTEEHDIGLYLKRAMVLAASLGNARAHEKRYASILCRSNAK